MIDLLLKNGASLKTRNIHNATPIHLSIEFTSPDIIDKLLGYSDTEDINARDINGNTPLHWTVLASDA